MKPVSISFSCFGPYIHEQTVRFDRLAEYGLFLICGETGSGKTTILDAMCCALYGSCSGELRGDLVNMRCKQANPEDPTDVKFIFEIAGRRYRFERKLTPKKTKKAEISFNESNLCEVESGGQWVPLLDNCTKTNMNKKARDLIGFTLDQFRQVIILPQGKFETLLTSKSEDKENILSTIFHTERWEKTVDRMNEELKTRKAEIDRDNQTIQSGLARWQLSAVGDLPEAVKTAKETAEDAAKKETEAKSALDRAQARRDLNNEYIKLDNCLRKYENAKNAMKEDHQLQVRLDMAARAEKARIPHDEWVQAKEGLTEADLQLKKTEEQLASAAAKRKQAEEKQNAHEAMAPEQQKRESELIRLTALRTQYESIDAQRKTADDAKKLLGAAEKKKALAEKTLNAEKAGLLEKEQAWNDAAEVYTRISKTYQAQAAGHLAASLTEGQACPVCGNTHHPCLAKLPEGSVDSRDVEDAEEKQTKARKAFDAQRLKKEDAEKAEREAAEACRKAEGEFSSAETALRRALEQRDPELETLADLDRRNRELKSAIDRYTADKESLSREFNQADVAFRTITATESGLKEQLEKARKELSGKEEAWKKALEETGLGTEAQYNAMIMSAEAQLKLQRTISEHKTMLQTAENELNEQREKISGTERPDSETVGQAYREAEQNHNEAIRTSARAVQYRDDLMKDAEMLLKLDEKIGKKRKTLEEDTVFVSALRGSSGMSIQRYVLSVRLGQVIREANSLLSGIYGGRYSLRRSDESYGSAHKSGLELEVYDSMNDQRRSVCTLSGGEKFLVALSLAIGLCTVVQNEQKGVNLDAMFIDEGFGSLDQSALGDALDVLQSVQKGHGMVGIISHVASLEETIPTKIVIKKTAQGSKLECKLG